MKQVDLRRVFGILGRWMVVLTALLACSMASAQSVPKQPRIALLIANQNYPSAKDKLGGPADDVSTLSKALHKQGFGGLDGSLKPTVVFDQSAKQIKDQILAFKQALERAGPLAIGFVYYAGHGGSDRGGKDNYLIPADLQGIESADLEKAGVGIRWITDRLRGIDDAQRPTIAVVVDACRVPGTGLNNPDRERARGTASPVGLRMIMPDNQQPKGVIVALSTGVGQTAGDSGIYAETLAEKLAEGGLSIVDVFEQVKIEVARKTGNAQIPVHQSQIVQKICVVSCADAAELAKLRGELQCNALRPEDLELAIRGENLERIKTILKCKREFLLAVEVRSTITALFRPGNFARRQGFLSGLQSLGIHFVADMRPENPDVDSHYSPSPLRVALSDRNVEAVRWLTSSTKPEDFREYRKLAAIYVKSVQGLVESERPKSIEMLGVLVRAGLPVDSGDYEAYRLAHRFWLETQYGSEHQPGFAGFQGSTWNQYFGTGRPKGEAEYWRSVAELVAPKEREQRKNLAKRTGSEFAKPRIETIEGAEKQLKEMLAGSGSRQIQDPRSPLGYREVPAPAGTLRDDDMVLDMNQLLSATSWISVSGIRDHLKRLSSSKDVLRRLAASD